MCFNLKWPIAYSIIVWFNTEKKCLTLLLNKNTAYLMNFILFVGAYIYLFFSSLFINEMRPAQKNKAGGGVVCLQSRTEAEIRPSPRTFRLEQGQYSTLDFVVLAQCCIISCAPLGFYLIRRNICCSGAERLLFKGIPIASGELNSCC